MTKEKQIDIDIAVEEMASVLRGITVKCDKCECYKDGTCLRPIDVGCDINEDILNECDALYNQGYRKQRAGKWKSGKTQNGAWGYSCTICGASFVGENAEWIAKEHDYCPRCGAKMKE